MKLKSLRLRLCTWPFSLPAEEDEEEEEELVEVEEDEDEEQEEECGAPCWSSVSAPCSRSSPAKSVGGDGGEG